MAIALSVFSRPQPRPGARRPPAIRPRSSLPAAAFTALLASTPAPASPFPAPEGERGLEEGFQESPPSARPWVYWFWMDGNLSREEMTADLEAMARAGLGGVIIMEVDVGVPRGPVPFMSPPWRELFKHAAAEAARLGLEIDLNASPGWTGTGGPWVKPEQSMQKLVASELHLSGPQRFAGLLPAPPVREGFYRDVAVLAFPSPAGAYRIPGIEEKALYVRRHTSSEPGVATFIPPPLPSLEAPLEAIVPRERIVELTARLDATGRLAWEVPPGDWTVLRLGRTSTGANTRPAPAAGLGLECDKLDRGALEAHFQEFPGKLLEDLGPLAGRSLVSLHIDSWEMGPQNWTARFREEFHRRRRYDPLPYLPVMTGRVVESLQVSERFLWDLRQTVSELIRENHAAHLRALARRHGLRLSIEPYDGTPGDDLTYGAVADVPMCEFWALGFGFDTVFSAIEAASVAHVYGRPVVAAEAFTAGDGERWRLHPGAMKVQADWAFCQGINRLVFHRWAHQPWLDRWPGMTMGPYGVHYERTQTWWELTPAWHAYLARCQFLLQEGTFVADVAYLAPEGAPHVFRPPASAMRGFPPDRLGYNFDGCTPEALLSSASVEEGRLVFPSGASYRALVLPQVEAMTPELLRRIRDLVAAGATVLGGPPRRAPGLSGYPRADEEVRAVARELWGAESAPPALSERPYGKGRVFWGGGLRPPVEAVGDGEHPLRGARWIWHREGSPEKAAPAGKRYFRRRVMIDPAARIEAARAVITADNAFELWVNGRPAGSGSDFRRVFVHDVTALLEAGRNVVAVCAVNGGEEPNPAGLIGALRIELTGGKVLEVPTDGRWESAGDAGDGWSSRLEASGPWSPAVELGGLGMGPWGEVAKPLSEVRMYPDHGVTSSVLARMGLAPDFEAAGDLRYTHRHAGRRDIYFVATGQREWLAVSCAFRVSGKVPEIWDPLSGRIERPAVWEERDGRTVLPLWLEPEGSRFVVFREEGPVRGEGKGAEPIAALTHEGESVLPRPGAPVAVPPPAAATRCPSGEITLLAWLPGRYELGTARGEAHSVVVEALPAPLEVQSPWEVRFQPGRGAPERIVLAALSDWASHPDPGVRHFSGVGEYRTELHLAREWIRPGRRLFLDLGRVEVVAAVRLNGEDLGTLWKTPFRIDITAAARAGKNSLEVRVANLWPNRLIGDQALVPEERVTWTTWNPFSREAPLLPSGLLGPVTVRAAAEVTLGP